MPHTVTGQDFTREVQARNGSAMLTGGFTIPGLNGGFSVNQDQFLSPAQKYLKYGLKANVMRSNGTLDYDQWKEIDNVILSVSRPILTAVGDLMTGGFVHRLRNLGVTLSQYSRSSAMSRATVVMDPETGTDRDRVVLDQVYVPVPVIMKEFKLGIRQIQAAVNNHETIDITNAREAGITVSQEMEYMLISGSDVVVGGNPIYGYLTFPDRTVITTAADWGTVTNIYSSVLDMIAAAVADFHYGPYMLYVNPTQYAQAAQLVGASAPGITAQELVEKHPQILALKQTFAVPDGTGILVDMSSLGMAADLAIAQDIGTIQWEERGGMVTQFLVFAAQVPRLKSDIDGRSGVVVHINI